MRNLMFLSLILITLPLLVSLDELKKQEDKSIFLGSLIECCGENYLLVDRSSVSMWMNCLCMYPEL